MKILHVGQYDTKGGACRAMMRLHRALLSTGESSWMLVQQKDSDDYRVFAPHNKKTKGMAIVRTEVSNLLLRLQATNNNGVRTLAALPFGTGRKLNAIAPDIVNLHWLGGETLSIPEIGRIKHPVVWTLHDMWPFCGTEHYADDSANARWRNGYSRHNRLANHSGLDLDRWTWRRKQRHWQRPMTLISPTRWLADCAKASALMQNWPVHVIPNPLDTDVFRPLPRNTARSILGLPQNSRIILFGAIGGSRDQRKGFDLLHQAMLKLKEKHRNGDHLCLIVGESQPESAPDIGFPAIWAGHLHDDCTLNLVYNAANVMVIPSRQDNLPQSGTEAQACGCPVVAFDTGGLPDIIVHRETGYLARPFETSDLAAGIDWVLQNTQLADTLAVAARERAIRLWSHNSVIPRYLEVYRSVIESFTSHPNQRQT